MMRRLLPRVRHLLAVPLPDAPAAGAGEAASPPGRAVVPVTIVAARAAPQVLVVEDDPDILDAARVQATQLRMRRQP
ncbi:MAG TPA: hypothetical protein VFH47_02695, partial [Candidatus Thermoplasmatota archaeon]|nr:hypothetical protein [Candidatus Thermoplasmatota archaeon]